MAVSGYCGRIPALRVPRDTSMAECREGSLAQQQQVPLLGGMCRLWRRWLQCRGVRPRVVPVVPQTASSERGAALVIRQASFTPSQAACLVLLARDPPSAPLPPAAPGVRHMAGGWRRRAVRFRRRLRQATWFSCGAPQPRLVRYARGVRCRGAGRHLLRSPLGALSGLRG